MKKLKTMFAVALVAVMSMSFVAEDAFARRSGGSRSSSRSRSVSRPSKSRPSKSTPSKSKSWGNKKTKAAPAKTSKSWGKKTATTTKGRTTTKAKRTPAQQKSLETAKKNGTSFKSKDAATAAFKKNQAGKYPAKYATKPAARPGHVPQSTSVGGVSYNVNYNSGMGGYGYTNALGAFIMYDMMSDAIMRNRMMSQSHYIVDSPHVQSHHAPVVVHQRSNGYGIILTVVLVLGVLALVVMIKN